MNIFIEIRPPHRFAVRKMGQKRALGVFQNEKEAIKFALSLIPPILMEYRKVDFYHKEGRLVRSETIFNKIEE